MVSPVVGVILCTGITFAMFASAIAIIPGCIVVCDSHACDASTLDEDGRQQEGCYVYRSDETGTHKYRIENMPMDGKCRVPISHGLRCLVRV